MVKKITMTYTYVYILYSSILGTLGGAFDSTNQPFCLAVPIFNSVSCRKLASRRPTHTCNKTSNFSYQLPKSADYLPDSSSDT